VEDSRPAIRVTPTGGSYDRKLWITHLL